MYDFIFPDGKRVELAAKIPFLVRVYEGNTYKHYKGDVNFIYNLLR